MYLGANLALKEQALAKASTGTEPPGNRYRPDGQLMAFLKALTASIGPIIDAMIGI